MLLHMFVRIVLRNAELLTYVGNDETYDQSLLKPVKYQTQII